MTTRPRTKRLAATAGFILSIAGGLGLLHAQSQPMRPKDPLPGQKAPPPSRTDPQPAPAQPAQPTPVQPTQPVQPVQPVQPGQPPVQPVPVPIDANDPTLQPPADPNQYLRPFMFQSPQSEAALRQHTDGLLRMEQRMQTTRQDLLRRLGDARAMTGERRLDALTDVIQQMLMEQEQLHQYLVASRTAWTGDLVDQSLTAEDPRRPAEILPVPDRTNPPRRQR